MVEDCVRVLVVDDEPELAHAVAGALGRYGFEAVCVGTLAEGRTCLGTVGLVLLDLGLPDGDGLTVCAEFSAVAPVIVISARDEVVDRVVALEMGADDFLSKPFSTRELVARCRAVLRRSRSDRAVLRVMDLEVDQAAYEVRRNGELVSLTTKEHELLVALAAHQGDAVRRTRLAVEVWGADLGFVNRTLEVHVSSLRTKLGPAPDGGEYITTVHGVGYRMRR